MKTIKWFLLGIAVTLVPTLSTYAQVSKDYDLEKPFGWAVCTSLEGGDYHLNGGEGGETIILKNNGGDMSDVVLDAVTKYDVVILDGSSGPFTFNKTITLMQLQNKSLLGMNGATLRTAFKVDKDIKEKLEAKGVRSLSSMGNGGVLSNGHRVREEMEFHVRQFLIDYYQDEQELFRNSGLLKLAGCNNIIIRNIRFEGPGSIDVSGDDLLTASFTTHLWVDHCDFQDGMDANFDINNRSDFITVSWCKFSYSDRAYIHMNTNLVGANDHPSQGVDNLNVTYAYCIWGKGCDQRMPMARFGTIHVLNCLYDCAGNSAAANARKDSEMLLEGCYFMPGVNNPFFQRDAKAWNLKDNFFCDGFKIEDHGKVIIPYTYQKMNASVVPETLREKCGCQ